MQPALLARKVLQVKLALLARKALWVQPVLPVLRVPRAKPGPSVRRDPLVVYWALQISMP